MATSYAEIRSIPKGPTPETADLTLMITFAPPTQAIVDTFKALMLPHDRSWNPEAKVWYAHPRHLDAITAWAKGFDEALLIDGNRWLNIKTGRSYEQQELF